MKEIVKTLKAISNETRLTIMALLNQKELCVCQIEELLNLSQAKVSRHLTVLKNAGLVSDRREGLWIYYSIIKPESKIDKKIFELFHELPANKNGIMINVLKLKACSNTKKRGVLV